jgi:hypothetical protein
MDMTLQGSSEGTTSDYLLTSKTVLEFMLKNKIQHIKVGDLEMSLSDSAFNSTSNAEDELKKFMKQEAGKNQLFSSEEEEEELLLYSA